MSSQNDGKVYESMVHAVYSSLCIDEKLTVVEKNIRLAGPDGDRQIDVLVKHVHAGIEYLTIIECRDFSKKLTISHVDAFASVVSDVKASRGVLVSRKGFSKSAIQKANRLGIGLCIIDSANSVLRNLVIGIPLIVKVIHPTLHTKTILGKSEVERKIYNQALTTINDAPLRQLVIRELRDGRIESPDASLMIKWSPKDLDSPFYVRDANGEKVDVVSLKVDLQLDVWYLFGHTDNLPDSLTQSEVGGSIRKVFLPDRFKAGINESFARYESREEIPIPDSETLIGIYTPDEDCQSTNTYEIRGFLKSI